MATFFRGAAALRRDTLETTGMEHAQRGHGEGGHASMEPGTMMAQSPAHRPWVYPATMLLGAWLATGPTVLPYGRPALAWSDALSGVAAIVIASPTQRCRGHRHRVPDPE